MTPNEMRGAYGLGSYTNGVLSNGISFGGIQGDGRGQTIAIVDAYDYPTAAADLNAFSTEFGLPTFGGVGEPTFEKLNQTGGTTLPGTDPAGPGGWSVEESLDIEWAHSMAPMANIILFEANDASDNLYIAAKTAANTTGVVDVSMSWGGPEFNGETVYDSTYFVTPAGHIGGAASLGGTDLAGGVTFLASAGDSGAYARGTNTITPQYPASSPNVVGVGGTYLTVTGSNPTYAWATETGWGNGTSSGTNGGGGGGISTYESQPSYQTGNVNGISATQRTYPDIAADADPNSGAAVYDTYDFGTASPWEAIGGTSLACPMWAGMTAVADEGRAIVGLGSLDGRSQTLPELYKLPATDFHDITVGNNGYAAGPGYDLVTGIGAPIANLLIPGLVGDTPTVTAVNPIEGSTAGGTTVTITGTNFTGATTVEFGTIKGTIVSINAAGTQITATTPAEAIGTVDVTVAGPGGTSVTTPADEFTYVAGPMITALATTPAGVTGSPYGLAQTVPITVTFAAAVNVTGTPQLALNDSEVVNGVVVSPAVANYVSGSGTTTLTFNYVVGTGQNTTDLDYASFNALTLNGGSIQDASGNAAGLVLPPDGLSTGTDTLVTKNIVVVTPAVVTTASSTAAGIANSPYTVGQTVPITVNFNKAVTVSGTPQVALNNNGVGNYASGSGTSTLTFDYVVLATDQVTLDLDYASVGALTLNGGTILDSSGKAATLTLPATGTDGLAASNIVIVPKGTVVFAAPPPSPNYGYGVNWVVPITVVFSESVNVLNVPQLDLDNGGVAYYVGGTGTAALTFNYKVAATDQSTSDLDYTGVSLNGGSITGATGWAIPTPGSADPEDGLVTKNIVIDTTQPTVTGVSSPSTATSYTLNGIVPIKVTFNRPVCVDQSNSLPQLTLNDGGVAYFDPIATGTEPTNTLYFNYTVAAGQSTQRLDYASTGALTGIIYGQALPGNPAGLTLPSPATGADQLATPSIVIAPPTTVNVVSTAAPANGRFSVGGTIPITVIFSATVNVTGTPQLLLNDGGVAYFDANATGTAATNTLYFNYTVAAGQSTLDLDYASTTAIVMSSGGSIKDQAGNLANLALPTPGTSSQADDLASQNLVVGGTGIVTVTVTDAGGVYTGGTFPATAMVIGPSGLAASSLEGVSPIVTYYVGSPANGNGSSTPPSSVGVYTAVANFPGASGYTTATNSVAFAITSGQLAANATNQIVTPGLYDPTSSLWYLRNSNTSGVNDLAAGYGQPAGGCIPLVGDWTGLGIDTLGLYNPATGYFYLHTSNTTGVGDITFFYGQTGQGWIPVVGDWTGQKSSAGLPIDSVGLYDPKSCTWYLRNSLTTGVADITIGYGAPGQGWQPVVGDWTGTGTTTVGLYNPADGFFYLRNSNTTGVGDISFFYGNPTQAWTPVAGDWTGNGHDSIGMYDQATGTWYLRNSLSTGVADTTFAFGSPGAGWLPVVGDWTGAAGSQPAAASNLSSSATAVAPSLQAALPSTTSSGPATASTVVAAQNVAVASAAVESVPLADAVFARLGSSSQSPATNSQTADDADLLAGNVTGTGDADSSATSLAGGMVTTASPRPLGVPEVDAILAGPIVD
jgi:hypothetical protein